MRVSRRTQTVWIAWGVFTLSCVGWIVAVLGGALGAWPLELDFFVPLAGSSSIGLLLSFRRPENRLGWLLAWVGCLGVLLLAVNGLVSLADGRLADALAQVSSDGQFAVVVGGLLALLPLWFPTGTPPTRRWSWIAPSLVGLSCFMLLAVALDWKLSAAENIVPVLWILVGPVACIISLVVRYRRAGGELKHQIRWLIPPLTLMLLGLVASSEGSPVEALLLRTGADPNVVLDVYMSVAMVLLFIAIGAAIVKYRLYDIDRIISRTLSYAIVVTLLGIGYFGALTAVSEFLPTQSTVAVAASTLFAAAIFNPVRKRIQYVVDRRFNRTAYRAENVSADFTARLRESLDSDELTHIWNQTVIEFLQPTSSGVWIRR